MYHIQYPRTPISSTVSVSLTWNRNIKQTESVLKRDLLIVYYIVIVAYRTRGCHTPAKRT